MTFLLFVYLVLFRGQAARGRRGNDVLRKWAMRDHHPIITCASSGVDDGSVMPNLFASRLRMARIWRRVSAVVSAPIRRTCVSAGYLLSRLDAVHRNLRGRRPPLMADQSKRAGGQWFCSIFHIEEWVAVNGCLESYPIDAELKVHGLTE